MLRLRKTEVELLDIIWLFECRTVAYNTLVLPKLFSVNFMTDRMLQFFTYAHLSPHLQAISKPFCECARQIVDTLPQNPERTVALRKLLEAKDCAVRASLYKEEA